MTPKADFFGRIEDYCLDLLNNDEKREFERELEVNCELRNEVKLHKNLHEAILETDILDLRNTLSEIKTVLENEDVEPSAFELLDKLSEIKEETNDLSAEHLLDNFESLPKVHVYQHERTSNESIHEFYKEQSTTEEILSDEELDLLDTQNLEGLEEAVLENDIFNLRESLQQVAKSIEPQYSTEEIDDFLNHELDENILAEFEGELEKSEALRAEVDLHKDIEEAVAEHDILNLRNSMRSVMESETSWNVSEDSIEDFMDGMLEEELLEEFNAELGENTDLMAEVALREQINSAIGEKDIMDLRASLEAAQEQVDEKETKSIITPKLDIKSARFWRNSVAAVVVVATLAGGINAGMNTVDNTYNKYFDSPTWASERSVNTQLTELQAARSLYQHEEYDKVIELLESATIRENEAFVAHFYMGVSYQNLDDFGKASDEYAAVLKHGNNLFVEEAEWYRALCALKLDNKKLAKRELLAVIERRGHYERDAKAIIRRLRFSFK